jgi:hypothetical protein
MQGIRPAQEARPDNHTANSPRQHDRVARRCDNRSCRAAQVRLYIPATEAEATMWLAGDPLPAEREARDDRDPREN